LRKIVCAVLMLLIITAGPVLSDNTKPGVILETSLGNITIELDSNLAPKTVENFLYYVQKGFFNETVFHRVIKGFMIQGGGLTTDLVKKSTEKPVINEADNGLKNNRGTIAMARTQHPHSATSQFFINTADNKFLNHTGKTDRGWGYCVFGKVVKGIKVVDAIEKVATGSKKGRGDVPVSPVIIKNVSLVK
jgi:peptidyl-prolyl cis-trans isomerase B (cyclophilin B)